MKGIGNKLKHPARRRFCDNENNERIRFRRYIIEQEEMVKNCKNRKRLLIYFGQQTLRNHYSK